MLCNAVIVTLGVLLTQAASQPGPQRKQNEETAEIKGTLIDKTGKPAAGVALGLAGYGGIKDGRVLIVAISVKGKFPPDPVVTDRLGHFVFSGMREGKYVIGLMAGSIFQLDSMITIKQGGLSTPAGIEVKRGQSLDLGKVQLLGAR